MIHTPVLLNEVIEYLDPKPGQKFIDATINGGGHALAILEKIKPGGGLLGIEWDPEIYKNLESRITNHEFGDRLIAVNDNYVNIEKIANSHGFTSTDGILFDLGMSTWQLTDSERGFTFSKDEALDMRFNNEEGETAADILNNYNEEDIANLIYKYGEERYSRGIAREIIAERRQRPIKTTFQLVEAIKRGVPFRYRTGHIHFATRTFQALRIVVNHELENVENGIKKAIETVRIGGRVAVISFHSLEDRIVKNIFREAAKKGEVALLVKKPVVAGLEEKKQNPNSRSAKLRVVIKN